MIVPRLKQSLNMSQTIMLKCHLLACGAIQFGRILPTFRRYLVPPSSGFDSNMQSYCHENLKCPKLEWPCESGGTEIEWETSDDGEES
jgi:hypothetical protein